MDDPQSVGDVVTEDRDNPVVSLAIGLIVVALFALAFLAGCHPTRDTKGALRGTEGPSSPSHKQPEGVCVGPECEIPGAPGR